MALANLSIYYTLEKMLNQIIKIINLKYLCLIGTKRLIRLMDRMQYLLYKIILNT